MNPPRTNRPAGLTAATLAVALLLGAAWRVGAAADLTGSWALHFNPDVSGNASTGRCRFAQDGEELGGTCDGGAPVTGKVTGSSVSWRIQTDGNTTVFFTATLDPDGAKLTDGTWLIFVPDGRTQEGKFEGRKE